MLCLPLFQAGNEGKDRISYNNRGLASNGWILKEEVNIYSYNNEANDNA